MTKNGVNKTSVQINDVQKILITQPRPESEKSPYFELSRKYNVELDFYPFIRLEGIPARDFRKQKIEIYVRFRDVDDPINIILWMGELTLLTAW